MPTHQNLRVHTHLFTAEHAHNARILTRHHIQQLPEFPLRYRHATLPARTLDVCAPTLCPDAWFTASSILPTPHTLAQHNLFRFVPRITWTPLPAVGLRIKTCSPRTCVQACTGYRTASTGCQVQAVRLDTCPHGFFAHRLPYTCCCSAPIQFCSGSPFCATPCLRNRPNSPTADSTTAALVLHTTLRFLPVLLANGCGRDCAPLYGSMLPPIPPMVALYHDMLFLTLRIGSDGTDTAATGHWTPFTHIMLLHGALPTPYGYALRLHLVYGSSITTTPLLHHAIALTHADTSFVG